MLSARGRPSRSFQRCSSFLARLPTLQIRTLLPYEFSTLESGGGMARVWSAWEKVIFDNRLYLFESSQYFGDPITLESPRIQLLRNPW